MIKFMMYALIFHIQVNLQCGHVHGSFYCIISAGYRYIICVTWVSVEGLLTCRWPGRYIKVLGVHVCVLLLG